MVPPASALVITFILHFVDWPKTYLNSTDKQLSVSRQRVTHCSRVRPETKPCSECVVEPIRRSPSLTGRKVSNALPGHTSDVGEGVGLSLGWTLGDFVGALVGSDEVGDSVGDKVGVVVGSEVVGALEGGYVSSANVGDEVEGELVGSLVVGAEDIGERVGAAVGEIVGNDDVGEVVGQFAGSIILLYNVNLALLPLMASLEAKFFMLQSLLIFPFLYSKDRHVGVARQIVAHSATV